MSDTQSLFDLVGDAGRLASRIDIVAADLFGDDPEAAAAASTELEELINAESDNQEAIFAKADCWAWVINRYRATATARADQAERLAALAKADETAADVMQHRLILALGQAFPAETRFNLPSHVIASRRSEAVEITCDPADLPERYQRVKVEVEADKRVIKEALKAGTTVPGCRLAQRRSWTLS